MSYTAKSVIFDIADGYGGQPNNTLALRSVEFFFNDVLVEVLSSNAVAYATTQYSISYQYIFPFDTSLSKLGSYVGTEWLSAAASLTNQRLICVFGTEIEFDEIRVNNAHYFATQTTQGIKDTKIYISSDAITSTVYAEAIANSNLIFDGTIDEHTAVDEIDDQVLTLIVPWDGTIDTPEMITTTSSDSDIQIGLSMPEAVVTTIADSSLFVGVPIITPEILVTTGVVSDLQLNINSSEAVVTTGADSDIQLQLDSPESLVTTSALSGIFVGVLIVTPEMLVTTSAEADLQLQLDTPESLITTEGAGDIQLQLVGPEIIVTTGMSSIAPDFFTTGDAKVRFFLNITGAADGLPDVEIPISSFQARKRSDANTYLSAVIPDIDYIDTLTNRSNGTMQIKQGYEKNGVILQKDVIIEAELETLAYDQGGTNQSITVSGYKDQTFTAKAVLLTNATYKSLRNGKLRFRFAEPNIYLNPGDTATIGSDTLIVDTMSYAISAESVNNFEITEV